MEKIEYKKMYLLETSHWWFASKRKFIKTIIKGKKFPKILDIGCGTGENMEMLSAYGQVWGLDISMIALEFCRQRGLKKIQLGSANKLPFKSASFDLITLFDVLYHQGIKSDLQVLQEAHKILKTGGYILITDCAYQWLYGSHDIAMNARQRYTKQELVNKLKQAGFSIKKASYIFMLTFPLFLIIRLLKKYFSVGKQSDVKSLPLSLNQALIILNYLEAVLLQLINLPFGSSIIILAQK